MTDQHFDHAQRAKCDGIVQRRRTLPVAMLEVEIGMLRDEVLSHHGKVLRGEVVEDGRALISLGVDVGSVIEQILCDLDSHLVLTLPVQGRVVAVPRRQDYPRVSKAFARTGPGHPHPPQRIRSISSCQDDHSNVKRSLGQLSRFTKVGLRAGLEEGVWTAAASPISAA